jgi:methionine-rich copper-binding protein CopC
VTSGGRQLAVVLYLSALWLVLACTPALAHARLLEATPGGGATLSQPSEQVRLRFSEPVEAAFDPVEVYNEQDRRVDQDDTRVASDDPEVLVTDLEPLSRGSYTVEYRVTSQDGHVIDGKYEFKVAAGAARADGGEEAKEEEPAGPAAEGQGERSAGAIGWAVPVAVLVGIVAAIVGFAALRRR